MSLLYLSGRAHRHSNDELFLTDQLLGMGTAITSDEGSLAWIEAQVFSRCFCAGLNFVKLMSNQLSASDLSIFADRYAAIYGLATQGSGLVPDNIEDIKTYIGLKEAVIGTPPTLSAFTQFVKTVLDQVYLDIEYVDYHVQSVATLGPLSVGQSWSSPLSTVLVRIWQPRDNQDNALLSFADFLNRKVSYKAFAQSWLPADIAVRSLHLMYAGANTLPNYAGATNVVSGTITGTTITGTGTTFVADFPMVPSGYQMPIEVVADDNKVYTYHVTHVDSNTSLTVLEPISATFTLRTYRLLGVQMDVPNVLDNSALNS